jgi:hypothetical protein
VKAVNIWEITRLLKIAWLVELPSSNAVVGEKEVRQAARGGIVGGDIMRILMKRGDVQFTEGAIHALARYFNYGAMQLLLKNNDVSIIHGLIKETAANQKSGNYIMGLLLE